MVPFYSNTVSRKLVGLGSDVGVSKIPIPDFFPKSLNDRFQSKVIPNLISTGYWEGELAFQHFQIKELIPVL